MQFNFVEKFVYVFGVSVWQQRYLRTFCDFEYSRFDHKNGFLTFTNEFVREFAFICYNNKNFLK